MAMNKSFKAITLESWLEMDGLRQAVPLQALAVHARNVMDRRRPLLSDLDADMRTKSSSDSAWQHYWLDNPIKALTRGNLKNAAAAFFEIRDGHFELKQAVQEAEVTTVTELLQELVDYRLAAYKVRKTTTEPVSNVIPFPIQRRELVELPYFPNLKIACGHFKTGRADAEEHRALPASYGAIDPSRYFIARASGNSMNGGKNPVCDGDYLLLELITPSRAGSITGNVVAIERQDDSGDSQYLLRVVTKSRDGQYILKANNPDYADLPATDDMRTLARLRNIIDPLDLAIGGSFMREDIPPLFGEVFNPGNWNVGHVVLASKKAHILLITLNKQGKAEEHKYLDHWVDDTHFHWQSQNSTDPNTKRGQEIIEHAKLGVHIHLFVREHKLLGTKAAPFTYHGRAKYLSHKGSRPMSVLLELAP